MGLPALTPGPVAKRKALPLRFFYMQDELNLNKTNSVWSANSTDMIFQNEKWEGKSLGIKNKSIISVNEAYPASSFRAFYIDLKYKVPTGGTYTESTRMFVTDNDEIFLN